MTTDLVELMTSLASIIEQENSQLRSLRYGDRLDEISAAKGLLTGELTGLLSRLDRERPNWRQDLDEAAREPLKEVMSRLDVCATENAQLLERQIELSQELMDVLAESAKRGRHGGISVYGATGSLNRAARGAPISVNASL